MKKYIFVCFIALCASVVGHTLKDIFAADENLVCKIKKSCVECLRLPQCSWCQSINECFSKKQQVSEEFCKTGTVDVIDHGYSLEDNAKCACIKDELQQNCSPPGGKDGTVCSGRGTCVCGRCICDSPFDVENPTKFVVGEYCDYDNFSCDGPRCNEGPYPLVEVETENIDR